MNTIKILVADDAYSVRMTVRYRLALEKGLELFVATNAWQALQQVRSVRPHLLLLASTLTMQTGKSLVEAIRAEEQIAGDGHRTRIVLFEERGRPASAEALSAEPVDVEEVLYKPFDLERLVQRVRVLSSQTEASFDDSRDSLEVTYDGWCTA